MAKFMNAELTAIRDNLCCGHCGSIFAGSDGQSWKVKYEQKTVYCSDTCRHAALRNKFSTPIPNRGPCHTCGEQFFSRTAKIYCCMDCYVKSEQFKQMLEGARKQSQSPESIEKRAALARTGGTVECLECGEEVYQQLRGRRKFCTTTCYRSFMAKRFDRWVANPEGLALPQCYDEFLDREVLSCLVEDCDWVGQSLTTHMNIAHGFPARDFKRAAGFNLHTGVIAKPLAQALQARPLQGEAMNPPDQFPLATQPSAGEYVRYMSSECREHRKKARALAGSGPVRTCLGCLKEFQQSSPFGRALYCCTTCRDSTYYLRRKQNSTPRVRDSDGRYTA